VAKMSEKFYAECTPGYYNNEGQAGNPHSYFANTYGAGPLRFFDILANWRDAGDMPGTVLSTLQRT
jgi:cyclohexanone monooxygenase